MELPYLGCMLILQRPTTPLNTDRFTLLASIVRASTSFLHAAVNGTLNQSQPQAPRVIRTIFSCVLKALLSER